jgi:hypothetical protein
MAQTTLPALKEMQRGLRLVMDAVKKGDTTEAERLLLVTGGLLDDALRAERQGSLQPLHVETPPAGSPRGRNAA